MRCYRMQTASEDPQLLLREENQWCSPGRGTENGARCEKCRGSVFPKAEGLYHHLLATDSELVGVLVELEAESGEEIDFDADQGAILVIPTSVEHVRPIEPEAVQTIKGLAAG